MPRLSIVIPYLGSKQRLEDTLVSVLANRPASCEVLVVHDGSYDDEYDLTDEVSFVVDDESTTFSELVNVGFWEASAEVVHLLKPGAIASDGWTEPALIQFDDPHVASVSPLLLREDAPDEIVAAGVDYGVGGARKLPLAGSKLTSRKPPRARVVGPTSAAGFYRLEAVEEAGDWEDGIGDAVVDVDLACTLKHLGYRTTFEQASRVFWQAESSNESSVQLGRSHERLFWRHANAFGRTRALALHPFAMLASVLSMGPLSLIGRLLASFESAAYQEYRNFLADNGEAVTLPMDQPVPARDANDHTSRRRAA